MDFNSQMTILQNINYGIFKMLLLAIKANCISLMDHKFCLINSKTRDRINFFTTNFSMMD